MNSCEAIPPQHAIQGRLWLSGTRFALRTWALVLMMTHIAAAQSFAPLATVDRPLVAARPVSFDAAGPITFLIETTNADKPEMRVVAADDLVCWGTPAEYGRGVYVLTADGGAVSAETIAVTGEEIDFLSPQFDSRTWPLAQARGIVLRPPSATTSRDRLFRFSDSTTSDRDLLLLAGGDRLEGTLTTLDSRHAALDTAVGPAKVELGRVSAVIFNPALTTKFDPQQPRTLVGLNDGTLLVCSAVSGTDRVQLTPLAAAAETQNAKPWVCRADKITFLARLGGKAAYLSDFTPAGYKHVPYFELTRPYQHDRNVNGGDLRAGGRRYLKGIGMTSTSRLTYPLDPAYRKFAAEIAIDDDAAGGGSVTFRVFVDTEEKFRSEIVRGGDAPVPIEIDVAGGRTLSLVVDFAERADELDHADWLSARLLP